MGRLIRRAWRYLTALLMGRLNELADPKVQLEQAIAEAQEQHRRLKEQAANVIANQKQTEMRLNRALGELEKVGASARQAVLMAADATRRGNTAKAAELDAAAESFANRLVAVEHEVNELKALHLSATQAADRAKTAVAQNATMLQRKLSERQKLLSQLDQARMAEQMNRAMGVLSETVGADVPTLDEVRTKIEARYARATGLAELNAQSVEHRMLEVEQQLLVSEAQTRLSKIRAELGLGPGTQPETPLGRGEDSSR